MLVHLDYSVVCTRWNKEAEEIRMGAEKTTSSLVTTSTNTTTTFSRLGNKMPRRQQAPTHRYNHSTTKVAAAQSRREATVVTHAGNVATHTDHPRLDRPGGYDIHGEGGFRTKAHPGKISSGKRRWRVLFTLMCLIPLEYCFVGVPQRSVENTFRDT